MGRTVAPWCHLFIHYGLERVLLPVAQFLKCSTKLHSKSCAGFLSCTTINHQTSTFANQVLIFHPFYMANPPESHLLHGHRSALYSYSISYLFRGSSLRQTNATHPSSHLHFCLLESACVFYLNRPCFTALYNCPPDTRLIDIVFYFMWKYYWCQKRE